MRMNARLEHCEKISKAVRILGMKIDQVEIAIERNNKWLSKVWVGG